MTDTPTPPPTAPLWAPSEPSHAPVGRILMIVAGILIVLDAGLVALVGAGLTWAPTTQRDSDGFFSTAAERLDTATPAITSDEPDLGVSPHDARWFDAGDLATVRIDVDGVGSAARSSASGPRPMWRPTSRGWPRPGSIKVMRILEEASGGRSGPEFASSHPNPGNRAERIARMIEEKFGAQLRADLVP